MHYLTVNFQLVKMFVGKYGIQLQKQNNINLQSQKKILDVGEKVPLEKGLNKIGGVFFFFFKQHILTSVQIDLSSQQIQTKLGFVNNTFINFFSSKFKIDFITVLQFSMIFINFF
eukprot:TRINITY_DN569_c0_g1_i8.p3 TRINITY_DN569_c0_g1~~TRINITY_DN569_c0_g1_i8.p3  ORF type:complete len:115 (-),score=2.47 TRINITY_DN569_c0_g1_i8:369-713(-)